MTELLELIKANWVNILAWIGGIVTAASIIVKLTPTQKDDSVLAGIIKVLSALGLFNPDGSMVGSAENKEEKTKWL